MTYEQRAAIKKLLQERQALQAERREQAIIDREDEDIFQLFQNRGKVDPCDTTRSVITLAVPARQAEVDDMPVDGWWQPDQTSPVTIYNWDLPWDRIIVGIVYIASFTMAALMFMGWLL